MTPDEWYEAPFELDYAEAAQVVGRALWRLGSHNLLSTDAEGLRLRHDMQTLMDKLSTLARLQESQF